MEFRVYGHQIMSCSDVGMHFSSTIEQSKKQMAEYREALQAIDPTGEPLGVLRIYEMVVRMPDAATMIDLLNSPESIFAVCVVSKKLVAFTVG